MQSVIKLGEKFIVKFKQIESIYVDQSVDKYLYKRDSLRGELLSKNIRSLAVHI